MKFRIAIFGAWLALVAAVALVTVMTRKPDQTRLSETHLHDLKTFVAEVSSRMKGMTVADRAAARRSLHALFVEVFGNERDSIWTKYSEVREFYDVVQDVPTSDDDVIVRPKDLSKTTLCVFADLHVNRFSR